MVVVLNFLTFLVAPLARQLNVVVVSSPSNVVVSTGEVVVSSSTVYSELSSEKIVVYSSSLKKFSLTKLTTDCFKIKF